MDYFFAWGAAGNGLAPNTPANQEDFLQGNGGWDGTFNAAADTATISGGVFVANNNFLIHEYGSESALFMLRVADPGEIDGIMDVEVRVQLGTFYSHRLEFPKYIYTWSNTPGAKITSYKPGGDGLGFIQLQGPSTHMVTIRGEGNPTSLGARYVNVVDGQLNGAVYINRLELAHGRNNDNGPGLNIRDYGNYAIIKDLVIEITDLASERYSSGYIRAGGLSNFDGGNRIRIHRVTVTNARAEDFLFEVGANVFVRDASNIGLMQPRHPNNVTNKTDNGVYTCIVDGQFRQVSGRTQGILDASLSNEPTLAGLNLDGEPFSLALYPTTVEHQISPTRPLHTDFEQQLQHTEAAPVTIALELLLDDDLDGRATTADAWIDVYYKAAGGTGLSGPITTKVNGAGATLPASPASWSANSYLGSNLTARRLEVTTPEDVEPGSIAYADFYWGVRATTTANFLLFSGQLAES
ncbi:MAG: hypothetical protein ACE366_16745 [Bradymonadia bacterium]